MTMKILWNCQIQVAKNGANSDNIETRCYT